MRFAERLVTDTSSVFVARNCDASITRRYGAPMSVARSRPFRRTRALSATRPRSSCHVDPLAAGRGNVAVYTAVPENTSASWPNVVHDTSRSTTWRDGRLGPPFTKADGPRAGDVNGRASHAMCVERLAHRSRRLGHDQRAPRGELERRPRASFRWSARGGVLDVRSSDRTRRSHPNARRVGPSHPARGRSGC